MPWSHMPGSLRSGGTGCQAWFHLKSANLLLSGHPIMRRLEPVAGLGGEAADECEGGGEGEPDGPEIPEAREPDIVATEPAITEKPKLQVRWGRRDSRRSPRRAP